MDTEGIGNSEEGMQYTSIYYRNRNYHARNALSFYDLILNPKIFN